MPESDNADQPANADHMGRSDPGREPVVTEVPPPQRTLSELPGFSEIKTKLNRVLLRPMTTDTAVIRTQSVLFEGPDGTSPDSVARATIGTLAESGFTVYEPNSLTNQRDRLALWEALADELPDKEPAVLWIPPESLRQTDCARASKYLNEFTDTNNQAVVLSARTYDPQRRQRRRHEPAVSDAMELRISVPKPDADRRQALLKAELETLAERNVRYDINTDDLRELAQQATTCNDDDCQAIVRRAAVLATNTTPEHPEITPKLLGDAIEQHQKEMPNTTSDRDNRSSNTFEATPSDVTFDDIGGLDGVIDRLRRLLVVPRRYADLYADSVLSATQGVLLHGPPGTGKTMLAAALANESNRTFYSVDGAAVKSKWFGQSEQRVRDLFEEARDNDPSLVFFDEFDALAGHRTTASHSAVESIVATLLAELDGLDGRGDVFVVAATNRPAAIDPAIRRPGRLGEAIEVPTPDETARKDIFAIHLDGLPTATGVTPEWAAEVTPKTATGADINGIVESAVHNALGRHSDGHDSAADPVIEQQHLSSAVDTVVSQSLDGGREYH